MATIQRDSEQAIAGEAVDFLSGIGSGFDDVLLKVAMRNAANRPEGQRDVQLADVKDALRAMDDALESALRAPHPADGHRKASLESLHDFVHSRLAG